MRIHKFPLLAATLLLAASSLVAQESTTKTTTTTTKTMSHQMGQMPMDCQAMMQKMHAASKAADDRLAALISDMNSATGSAKVDRMAAVLTELVAQRQQMQSDQSAMMQHMTEHMQSGDHSMANCPMMSGKKAADQPAEHKH